MTGAPNKSWLIDTEKKVADDKWFFIAGAIILLLGICVGGLLWQCHALRHRRANYTTLAVDDQAVDLIIRDNAAGTGDQTKELYAVYDEDADEETGFERRSASPPGQLRFHSGFLDDDEIEEAGSTIIYKDNPDGSMS